MRLERTHLLTILYILFTLLFTWYITAHRTSLGHHKGDEIWYCLKFILVTTYGFLILQGLIFKSRNWGILLLLPIAILIATILLVCMLVLLLHLGGGGGTLLNTDRADIIAASLISISCTLFTLRYIK